jgi:hypothetical protein
MVFLVFLEQERLDVHLFLFEPRPCLSLIVIQGSFLFSGEW